MLKFFTEIIMVWEVTSLPTEGIAPQLGRCIPIYMLTGEIQN